MAYAEEVYKEFWKVFEVILKEKGEPFSISHGWNVDRETSWSNVNKNKSYNSNALDLSLQTRKKIFRIDFYMIDKNTEVGRIMMNNKDYINKTIPVALKWEDGSKGKSTLRISYYMSYYDKSYRQVIEESIPIIEEFIAVGKTLANRFFFDF